MIFQFDFPAICFEADFQAQQQRESISCRKDKSALQIILGVNYHLLFQSSRLYFYNILEEAAMPDDNFVDTEKMARRLVLL